MTLSFLQSNFVLVTWPAPKPHPTSLHQSFVFTITDFKMISDDDLYRLAIFLGSAAMLLIILYHFLEVNAVEEPAEESKVAATSQTDIKAAPIGR